MKENVWWFQIDLLGLNNARFLNFSSYATPSHVYTYSIVYNVYVYVYVCVYVYNTPCSVHVV